MMACFKFYAVLHNLPFKINTLSLLLLKNYHYNSILYKSAPFKLNEKHDISFSTVNNGEIVNFNIKKNAFEFEN